MDVTIVSDHQTAILALLGVAGIARKQDDLPGALDILRCALRVGLRFKMYAATGRLPGGRPGSLELLNQIRSVRGIDQHTYCAAKRLLVQPPSTLSALIDGLTAVVRAIAEAPER